LDFCVAQQEQESSVYVVVLVAVKLERKQLEMFSVKAWEEFVERSEEEAKPNSLSCMGL
jgi:hypothetical protein